MPDSKPPPDLPDRLGFVVEGEARRLLAESELEPDPTLVAEGWERRFIADKQRADEAMDLYRSLGYEVCAKPLGKEEIGPDCDDCQLVMLLNFTTIYTRKKPAEEL
jgi:hypothetical protein